MPEIPIRHRTVTKALHGYPKKHGLDIEWISNELWNQFNIKVAHSTVQRYLNPDDDLKLPADLMVPICVICNNDFSVCSLVKRGFEKIEINTSTIALLMKEASEAITELATTIEDGKITHEERQRCIKELLDLKQLVGKLLATLIE